MEKTDDSNIITRHQPGRPQERALSGTVEQLRVILDTLDPTIPIKIRLCLHCSTLLLQRHDESNTNFAKRKCCDGRCGQLMRAERERNTRLSKRALDKLKHKCPTP